MKRPGSRMPGLIGALTNVLACLSLFLPYATLYFRDDPQFATEPGTAWSLLFPVIDAGTSSVPFWYYLFSGLFLCSILFPLGLHLASLGVPLARRLLLWSCLVSLIGVIWCLFMDVLILGSNHYGSTQAYRFEPGAGILLLCLLLSGGCDIYARNLSKR